MIYNIYIFIIVLKMALINMENLPLECLMQIFGEGLENEEIQKV